MVELPRALSKAPVGKTRISREALARRQRERILTAATEVFAKRGFQATTLDNIIGAAGIGVGSFYAHFDGKEDCLMQVCESISARVRDRVAAVTPPGASWAQRACAGIQGTLSLAVDEPLAARVLVLEAQTGGPQVLARCGEAIDAIAAFLREGRSEGTVDRSLPASFDEATASGLVWLLQGRLARGDVTGIEPLFGEMARIALEPYLGSERAEHEIAAFTASA
jgi:AcrR family transcriptional regulator